MNTETTSRNETIEEIIRLMNLCTKDEIDNQVMPMLRELAGDQAIKEHDTKNS